ncbi:hypothetical protein PF005_g3670 [Phytophthora fragariae]|uniref:Uncharacterized protein n=1 Tax=Phytophthora fragariae TaxID=53985 RepID=A0A6A3Z468_9STRA|nr:hypothetical protein PF003_g3508 [Phytophthora fragariae]KAE9229956.1 hypothetical protein PF005_g3670 [Phytophthora fragariae]
MEKNDRVPRVVEDGGGQAATEDSRGLRAANG